VIKNFGLANTSEHQKKVAFRQWSTAAQYLREAIEKVVMVAHDEGQLTSEEVQIYHTSCTLNFAASSYFSKFENMFLFTFCKVAFKTSGLQ